MSSTYDTRALICNMYTYVCLVSVSVSECQSEMFFVFLQYLSVCLHACLSVCLSVCIPVCLSVCIPVCLSLSLYHLYLSVCASKCFRAVGSRHTCLPFCLSVCLIVCLSVCMYVSLYVCLCFEVVRCWVSYVNMVHIRQSKRWWRSVKMRLLEWCTWQAWTVYTGKVNLLPW